MNFIKIDLLIFTEYEFFRYNKINALQSNSKIAHGRIHWNLFVNQSEFKQKSNHL